MPDEVLIADDGSNEHTAKLVAQWSQRLPVPMHHLWQEDEGYRLARSRNRAVAAACGEYLVVIDGDMVLHPDFVGDHVRAAERGWFVQGLRIPASEAGTRHMLATREIEYGPLSAGIRRRHLAVRNGWLARQFSRDYVTMRRIKGCNHAYWRSDLIAVNGFEERMIGWGPEDKECVTRLLNSGVRGRELRFTALALHLHHASRAPAGVNPNDLLYQATVASRRTRSEVGIDLHLAEFAGGIPGHARPPWPV
jgi:glycosyltransferase involved in cell wall biosynthesis